MSRRFRGKKRSTLISLSLSPSLRRLLLVWEFYQSDVASAMPVYLPPPWLRPRSKRIETTHNANSWHRGSDNKSLLSRLLFGHRTRRARAPDPKTQSAFAGTLMSACRSVATRRRRRNLRQLRLTLRRGPLRQNEATEKGERLTEFPSVLPSCASRTDAFGLSDGIISINYAADALAATLTLATVSEMSEASSLAGPSEWRDFIFRSRCQMWRPAGEKEVVVVYY